MFDLRTTFNQVKKYIQFDKLVDNLPAEVGFVATPDGNSVGSKRVIGTADGGVVGTEYCVGQKVSYSATPRTHLPGAGFRVRGVYRRMYRVRAPCPMPCAPTVVSHSHTLMAEVASWVILTCASTPPPSPAVRLSLCSRRLA